MIEKKPISELKLNETNPRIIKDPNFKKLVNSILVSPRMLEVRPIVINIDNTILGGNMRCRALKSISTMDRNYIIARLAKMKELEGDKKRIELLVDFWDEWKNHQEVPVIVASNLTDKEKQAFIIKDNASFGEWDWDALANEWEAEMLIDWGVEVPAINNETSLEMEEREAKPFDKAVLVLVYNPEKHGEVISAITPLMDFVEIKNQMI